MWTLLGQAPEKILMDLHIVRTDSWRISAGRAVVQNLRYWISALVLGLGFL